MSTGLWANCVLATVAAAVNLWRGRPSLPMLTASRVVRLIRGALAGAYAVVYWLLACGAISGDARVAWAQAIGILAWPLAWTLPALVTVFDRPPGDRLVQAVADRLGVD